MYIYKHHSLHFYKVSLDYSLLATAALSVKIQINCN